MLCSHPDCGNEAEDPARGRDECFRHRVLGVGFKFQGGAIRGRSGFHTTRNDWLRENLNVGSERELLKRKDVERA